MENKIKKVLESILDKTKKDILKWNKINLKIRNNRFLNFYVKKYNLLIGSIDIYESSLVKRRPPFLIGYVSHCQITTEPFSY